MALSTARIPLPLEITTGRPGAGDASKRFSPDESKEAAPAPKPAFIKFRLDISVFITSPSDLIFIKSNRLNLNYS
jgi:hypothetical protein